MRIILFTRKKNEKKNNNNKKCYKEKNKTQIFIPNTNNYLIGNYIKLIGTYI